LTSNFFFWTTLGVVAAVPYCSLFEWVLHRFVMHRPVGAFTYPFERHALVHHRIFRADQTYHLIRDEDKHTIPMAWWAAWYLGQWGLLCGAALASAGYYGTYEYLHWCMHLPRKRSVERSGIFFRLNGHHLLHHRYMGKNFNVVFPLADLCLGTLLLRSKVSFKQAQGPSVPNVQPRLPGPALGGKGITAFGAKTPA
jgi:hypothetical protein